MINWVATHRDLYRYGGLPASAWDPDPRAVTRIYLPQNVIEMPGHGFVGGELVRFVAPEDSPLRALPSGVSPTTWYTVANPTTFDDPEFFSLLKPDGSPLTFDDAGMGPIYMKENAVSRMDIEMAEGTSYVIANSKAYQGPWTTPPLWAPGLVARLRAPILCDIFRVSTDRYDVASVRARGIEAETFVNDHLREGEPMDDGSPAFDATSTPDNAAFAGRDRPPTCWRTGSL